ncbi:zinc finger, C3HC4 type [Oesophagostomum dentatum]|uniref:Zinc finger, C3HC4 type n=1 Tax=Oesophagostomum dentatum TaxID=61180 RepID=A0A0B1TNN4_OESDE|nr:zinc finger, C3HC4 type [Oesophagostomum dentatum]
MENQPLIVKEVDEEVQTKDDTKPSQAWLPSQLLGSDLAASKGSLCSSTTALCRICHTECESPRDPFVSPCRCSGSLLYVHRSCLVHWLELSTRKMVPSPRCELCGYNYRRRNCINVSMPFRLEQLFRLEGTKHATTSCRDINNVTTTKRRHMFEIRDRHCYVSWGTFSYRGKSPNG